jgi:GT2 family glycosyltransferase
MHFEGGLWQGYPAGRTEPVRCSIIVPTYNRAQSLRRALNALVRLDYDDAWEVLVVDDGSADETERVVREEFPSVRYFRFAENRGQWAARNLGMSEAKGDLFAFTDDDCIVGRDWLRRHVARHGAPRVGAVGGPVEPRLPTFCDKFSGAHTNDVYREEQQLERLTGWEDLITGNLSVSRAVIERVGTFDERFMMGADVDLVRRISRAGYTLVRDPALAVEHLKTYSFRSFLADRFAKASGSIGTDVKEGTVRPRRFVPLPNPVVVAQTWRRFRQLYGGSAMAAVAVCSLAVIVRWTEVAGRLFYYWSHLRHQSWEEADASTPASSSRIGRPSPENGTESSAAIVGAKSSIDTLSSNGPAPRPAPVAKKSPSGL